VDRNAFLAFALSFLVLSVWMTWQAENTPPPTEIAAEATPPAASPTTAPATTATPTPAIAPAAPAPAPAVEELIDVVTPLYHVVLTTRGAGVRRFELTQYEAPRSEGGGPVALIARADGESPAFATPFSELGQGEMGSADFRVVSRDSQQISFERTHAGVSVRKTYVFDDASYRMRLRVEVANAGAAPIAPEFAVALPEQIQPGSDFHEVTIAALVQGSLERELLASFGSPGMFGGIFGGTPEPQRDFAGDIEWSGAYSHYFLTALIPDVARDARVRWLVMRPGEEALVTMSQPPVSIPTGSSVTREYSIYAGPKAPEQLAAVGAQLDRSIDLGWSWMAPLTRAFNWLLKACYAVIPNYGVAIILLTVIVRLFTAPLAAKQMKSMKRMGDLSPKLKALQEKHKDDRQAQSAEMMKLYKEAGVNPLGGCLPMVLQIPVFIGL
jgi:YidC/Oxa1 family membrane protein insertase